MDKTLKDKTAGYTPSTKRLSQLSIDKWDRTSEIVLSILQRMDQTEAFIEEQKNNEWKIVPTVATIHTHTAHAHLHTIEHSIVIPSNIKETFEKLEEDFESPSRRVVWCDELENHLSTFEDQLENYNYKYLSWFVSTLSDAFAYNYAEQLTHEQLMILKGGVDIIYENNVKCDLEDYEKYYSKLATSGLSLLPTTQKAINEFGE